MRKQFHVFLGTRTAVGLLHVVDLTPPELRSISVVGERPNIVIAMSSENENKMKIFFCTGNINKMREFESILKAQYPELLNRMTLEHANIDREKFPIEIIEIEEYALVHNTYEID